MRLKRRCSCSRKMPKKGGRKGGARKDQARLALTKAPRSSYIQHSSARAPAIPVFHRALTPAAQGLLEPEPEPEPVATAADLAGRSDEVALVEAMFGEQELRFPAGSAEDRYTFIVTLLTEPAVLELHASLPAAGWPQRSSLRVRYRGGAARYGLSKGSLAQLQRGLDGCLEGCGSGPRCCAAIAWLQEHAAPHVTEAVCEAAAAAAAGEVQTVPAEHTILAIERMYDTKCYTRKLKQYATQHGLGLRLWHREATRGWEGCCTVLCGDPADAAAFCTKLRTEIMDMDSSGAKLKGGHVVLARQRVGVATGGATSGETFVDFRVEGYSSAETLGKFLQQILGSAGASGSAIATDAAGGAVAGAAQGKASPSSTKRGSKGKAAGGEGESGGSGIAVDRQGIELTFCVFPGAELAEESSEVATALRQWVRKKMMVGLVVHGTPGIVVLQTNHAPEYLNRAAQRTKTFMSFTGGELGVKGKVTATVLGKEGVGGLLRRQCDEFCLAHQEISGADATGTAAAEASAMGQEEGGWDGWQEEEEEELSEVELEFYKRNPTAGRVLREGRGIAVAKLEEVKALLGRVGCDAARCEGMLRLPPQ